MSRIRNIGFWGMALIALAGSTAHGMEVSSRGHPYNTIVLRNAFGLHAAPAQPNVPEMPAKPAPTLILHAIGTATGRRIAILRVEAASPQTGGKFLLLHEREARDEIAMLKIDERRGMVTVSAFGTVTNLTFERNGPNPRVVTARAAIK